MSEGDVPPNTALALARIEAKVDVVIARHEGRLDSGEAALLDHETRLRVIEANPVVRPRHVVTAVSLAIPAIAIIETAVLALFFGKA